MAAYETTIGVRTDDLGRSGHVNNSKFVAYTDLARDRYLEERHGYGPDDLEHLVVHLEIDYERELGSLTTVTVAVDVAGVGETSFTLEYELRSEESVVATVSTVAVVVEEGASIPIPDELRDGLEADRETVPS